MKGKIVHYKKKNGTFKRSRTNLAVAVQGYVYSAACGSLGQKSNSNPTTGYKKRRQLKVKEWVFGTIWRTKTEETLSSFANPEGYSGSTILTW